MELGVVTYYNKEKKFGFITTADGQAVFFHLTSQVEYRCDGADTPTEDGWTQEPRIGDRVVFQFQVGKKGQKAWVWCQEWRYRKAMNDIASRLTYRLRERNGLVPLSRLSPRPILRTMWEGEDLVELRKKFPKHHWPQESGELLGRFFEALVDGEWQLYGDPR